MFRARDELTGEPVALKILKPEKRSRNMLRRFALEAEVLLRINHPSIAKAIAFGDDGEHPFLALELVTGQSLRALMIDRVKNGELFVPGEIRAVFAALADGVAHAHALDVLHRDLKPQNIVITSLDEKKCELRILDFGIAKLLDSGEASEHTTRGRRLGSIYHMAPEQARGEVIDRRADVFSLGVIAFEMVTLREPWLRDVSGFPPLITDPRTSAPGNDLTQVMERILQQPRPRAGYFRGGVSDELDFAIDRALSIAPAMRPDTVEMLRDELDRGLATSTSELDGRPEIKTFTAMRDSSSVVPGTMTGLEAEPSYTWVRPVTIARAPDDGTASVSVTPLVTKTPVLTPQIAYDLDDDGRSNRRPVSAVPLGVALAVSVCAAVLAAFFTAQYFRSTTPPVNPYVPPAPAPVRAPVPVAAPAAAPLVVDEEDEEPAVAPDDQPKAPRRTTTPKKRIVVAEAPPDPRAAELGKLIAELRSNPGDAAVARIGRRVAAIAHDQQPTSEKMSSIERRATAAALSFDASAVEGCLLELKRELR